MSPSASNVSLKKKLPENTDANTLCIHLNKNNTNVGGFAIEVEESNSCTSAQKQLISKIKSLLTTHRYSDVICSDCMTMTHEIFSSIKKLIPQKTQFKKNGNELTYDKQQYVSLSFRLRKKNAKEYVFHQIVQVENIKINPDLDTFQDYGILTDNQRLYCWKDKEDLATFINTKSINNTIISTKNIQKFFQEYVQPLLKKYVVHIDAEMIEQYITKQKPVPALIIRQKNKHITFEILFSYNGVEVIPPVLNRYYVFTQQNMLTQIYRDEEEESHWLQDIISMHSDFKLNSEFQWTLPSKSFTHEWCDTFFDYLGRNNIKVKENQVVKSDAQTYSPEVTIKLNYAQNWFDAEITIKIDDVNISIREIQDAILGSSKEIFIDDQSYLLSNSWLNTYRNVFMWGKIHKDKLRFSHYQEHLFDILVEQGSEIKNYQAQQKIKKEITLPQKLKGQLRDYQKEGFQWINVLSQTNRGGILADDMGLGKTIQTLAQLSKFYETYSKLTALIICPASLINNWRDEISKFTPGLDFLIYHSHNRKLSAQDIGKHQIIITSYNILQKDIKMLKNINFDYIILDESQYIKNPYSKTARSVYQLNGKHKLCLTGTPLQNHTFDIYSQIHFLNPNVLGSIESFKNRFSILIDQFEENEPRNELKQLLDPFILRRTKKEVAQDLPEKTESIVYCKMEEAQREIYDYYRERYKNYLLSKIKKDGIQRSKLHVLQGLTFLRQICNSPSLVKEPINYNKTPIKLKMLQERLIEKDSGHKALIFSQFIGMLDIIKKDIRKDKWDFAYFDGKTTIEQRSKEINRFQQEKDCKLFLISIKAGNVGLNLTAADYVYLIDPWWNPAIEQQAIDRTHRIGQNKNIFAFKFICEDSIEEKILALQKKKSDLADNLIMLNRNSLIKNLDSEDIEYLFSH